MTPAVLVSLLVLGALLVAVAAATARAMEELAQLRRQAQRLGELRPVLAEVDGARRRLQAALRTLQR